MEYTVKKSSIPTEFFCNFCTKFYGCASSLCNHKKKFHTCNVKEVKEIKEIREKKNILQCEYCNKIFATRQSKSKHKIKICKFKNNIINNTLNNNIVNNNKIIKSNNNNFIADFTNNILIFIDKPIKFIYYNDQRFFKGIDIALMLDYIDTDLAISKDVDNKDIIIIEKIFNNDNIKTVYISESGFYNITLKSKKNEPIKFIKWYTFEVLPSIKQTENYNFFDNYYEDNLDKYINKDCVYILHIKDNIYKYGRK